MRFLNEIPLIPFGNMGWAASPEESLVLSESSKLDRSLYVRNVRGASLSESEGNKRKSLTLDPRAQNSSEVRASSAHAGTM